MISVFPFAFVFERELSDAYTSRESLFGGVFVSSLDFHDLSTVLVNYS